MCLHRMSHYSLSCILSPHTSPSIPHNILPQYIPQLPQSYFITSMYSRGTQLMTLFSKCFVHHCIPVIFYMCMCTLPSCIWKISNFLHSGQHRQLFFVSLSGLSHRRLNGMLVGEGSECVDK